ncbi:MAG: hypothetical protein VKM01_03005 [Cyanobacteriota bacterium]|nr:hypothetical protein [Cyanobacteriota bacterium]
MNQPLAFLAGLLVLLPSMGQATTAAAESAAGFNGQQASTSRELGLVARSKQGGKGSKGLNHVNHLNHFGHGSKKRR